MTPTDLTEFNQLLKVKYSFIAYVRTQVFLQRVKGSPFIRPLFFEFPTVDPDQTLSNQYMFGPSIISINDQVYSDKVFPVSNWCTVQGLSAASVCFNTSLNDSYDGKQMVFIKEGTITPLYSFNASNNFTGSKDLGSLSLDLHVFNNL